MNINRKLCARSRFAALVCLLLAAHGFAVADTPGKPGARVPQKRATTIQLPNTSTPTNKLPAVQNGRLDVLEDAMKQAASVVSGEIRIDNCAISHGLQTAVRILDNGRRIDMGQVSFERVADEFSSATRYTIKGLPVGTHSLSVELTPTYQRECAGGTWLPAVQRVAIKSVFSGRGRADFHYRRDFLDRSILGSLITAQVQNLFAGTQMRLNNHGPQRGRTNHIANDSVIQFPASLDNRSIRFDIPEFRSDPYRYYVQDINLRSISTRISGEYLSLTLRIEGDGPEFRGYCVTGNLACLPGRDDSAPDIQWQRDPRIEILLRPIAREGSITFGEVQVRVHGDIQAGGVCSIIDLCHLATHYEREIQRAIANNLRAFLNQTSVRRMVARGLRPVLDAIDIGHVMTAELRGGQLVVSYLPRA
jgi:hypothetical protein